jgi:tetratricopeptide (TPR) repeat protein
VEPFSGWTIVDEITSPLGGCLLALYRHVRAWADATLGDRRGLFLAGTRKRRMSDLSDAQASPELLRALGPVLEMLDSPVRAQAGRVESACMEVSAWAEDHHFTGAALAWALAAAESNPQSAEALYRVGLLARRRADYAVAETWLQQACSVARRTRDARHFVTALISLGNLHAQRGEYAQARELLERALRFAERPSKHGFGRGKALRDMQRRALHDLMTVAIHTSRFGEAEEIAVRALAMMPAGHPRLPVLAHDVAHCWMTRGCFGRALAVFRAVLRHIQNPAERILVLCNIARCAGAENDARVFIDAWAEIQQLAASLSDPEVPAGVWVNVARGLASLRRWEESEVVAARGAVAAELRMEPDQAGEAAAVLDMVRRRTGEAAATDPGTRTARELASGLVERLRTTQV